VCVCVCVCVKCLEKLIVRSDPLGFLLLTSERFNVTLNTRNQSCVCHLQLFYVCVRVCACGREREVMCECACTSVCVCIVREGECVCHNHLTAM